MTGRLDVGQSDTEAPTRFKGPMPAKEAAKLPKRERLELVKPILRLHQAEYVDVLDRDPYRGSRWSWIYAALREGGGYSGDLGQARREIECEDEHGHYWSPAWETIRVIDNGWHRYEVEVDYPRAIRRSERVYTREDKRQFHTRWFAQRWAERKKRAYERYVLRLLREGVYDDYGYDE